MYGVGQKDVGCSLYRVVGAWGRGGDIIPQILTDSIEGRVETILNL